MKTPEQWLAEVNEHADKLKSLLESYHPANRLPGRRPGDYITAPNAEIAATHVRKAICDASTADPVVEFETARANGDWAKIANLLNEAWFGVPESTLCWKIEGFSEAVALIEELPKESRAS
jgi:hypothetical protein